MSRYIITADGEGFLWDGESPVPDGAKLYDMSEEGGLIEINPAIATDPNLAYGNQGSLEYQLASLGGMGYNGGFDSAGFSNPDSVASFLEQYVPAGTDLSGAIQDAWQQQQNQFGYWSGADDPGQTALKILAQVDDPWAQQATQAIASSPEFAQSQYAGTAALNYDPDAGTFYGVPGPIASAALGMALGPMGLDFGAMLGGGMLGGAGTGALSSAIMGGDPFMGALTGSIAPGLGEMGLPSQYIPLASSLAGAAINGGDLTQGLMGGISGTLSQLSQSPTYNYTAEDSNYPSVFDETDAGMAEALSNPYLTPDLFTQAPTQEQPSFTATVVPDEPRPTQQEDWSWAGASDTPISRDIPEGYYYNEDYGRILPNGHWVDPATGNPRPWDDFVYDENTGSYVLKDTSDVPPDFTWQTLPQEQGDFPIYQPLQDMTGFKALDSPITQAAMGNYAPDPESLYQTAQPESTSFLTQDSPLTQAVLGNYIPDPTLQFDAPQTLYTDLAPDRTPGGVIDLGNSQYTLDNNMSGFYDYYLGLGDTDMTGFVTPSQPLPWEGASSDPGQSVMGDAAVGPSFDYMTPTPPQQGGIDWTNGGWTTNLGNSGGDMIPTTAPAGMSDDLWKLLKAAYGVMSGAGGATGGAAGGIRPPVVRPTMGQNILNQVRNDPFAAALSSAPFLLAMQQAQSQKNDIQPYIDKLNNLQGQFAGNESAYMKSITDPYDMQTARGQGDLTQSLSQRGVLGSSFGNADLANYGYMRDTGRGNLLAQAKTQGIGAQGGLINSALTATNNRNLAGNALIGAGLGAAGKLFQTQEDPFNLKNLLGV